MPSTVAATCVWEAAQHLHVPCDWDSLHRISQCSVEEREAIGKDLLECPSRLRNSGFDVEVGWWFYVGGF